MYTLIITFYISFFLIITMLYLKKREMATGQSSPFSRLGRGSDHVFSKVYSSINKTISYINKHTFIALAHWMVLHIFIHIRNVYIEIKHRFISTRYGRRLMDTVRGRGEVRNHGASLYLRRISTPNTK